MTMHDIARLSIYRQLKRASKRQQKEAMSIFPFFSRLQVFVQVFDVKYGPDSPDFVLLSGRKKVGIELTRLNRRIFSAGDPRDGEFVKWESGLKRKPQPKHFFYWDEYTLREVLEAMKDR